MRTSMSPATSWLLTLLLALPGAAATASNRDMAMPPGPEAALPPSLEVAKQALHDIAERRDTDGLLPHIHADTVWSFGGSEGPEGFHASWIESDQLQDFWRELDAILALPGRQTEMNGHPAYCAPYVFCARRPDGIDPFEAIVVLGTNVAIHAAPLSDAAIIARVDHAVLTVLSDDDDTEWRHVALASGEHGYIPDQDVRSLIDYRLMIVVDEATGHWWLQYFVAGD